MGDVDAASSGNDESGKQPSTTPTGGGGGAALVAGAAGSKLGVAERVVWGGESISMLEVAGRSAKPRASPLE